MLSIIIPYHNEGVGFIGETIRQIRDTIDVPFEIIVVDDGSERHLSLADVKVLRHPSNKGVGAAFDTGVRNARFKNIILMGSDIRFANNQWGSKMLAEIEAHPKAFIASTCIGLNRYSRCCSEEISEGVCLKCRKPTQDNMDFEYRRERSRLNGATILMFHDKKSNPKKTDTFRGILEAQWLPSKASQEGYEIPCLLGAFYGVKKSWFEYCDGWAGHRKWGTLEPMISLKSWMFGGSCRMAPGVETGHIFKKQGTHGTPQDVLIYNKMLVATMLIEDDKRFIDFLGSNVVVERGRQMYFEIYPWIIEKRNEYKDKIVLSLKDYCRKFDIDLR